MELSSTYAKETAHIWIRATHKHTIQTCKVAQPPPPKIPHPSEQMVIPQHSAQEEISAKDENTQAQSMLTLCEEGSADTFQTPDACTPINNICASVPSSGFQNQSRLRSGSAACKSPAPRGSCSPDWNTMMRDLRRRDVGFACCVHQGNIQQGT